MVEVWIVQVVLVRLLSRRVRCLLEMIMPCKFIGRQGMDLSTRGSKLKQGASTKLYYVFL